MIIYKTTNLINNKIYIGKDKNNNPKYFGSGKILKLAIKKYGIKNFKKEILEYCNTIEELDEREKYWINILNPEYNIGMGGNGGDTISNNPNKKQIIEKMTQTMNERHPNKGRIRTHTEIENWRKSYGNKWKGKNNSNYGSHRNNMTKKILSEIRKKWHENLSSEKREEINHKISIANTGKTGYWKGKTNANHSKFMKEKNPFFGKTHTKEIKKFLSELHKGKPKSELHKKKLSEANKGNKPSNMIMVKINGVVYESILDASKKLDINISTLRNRLKSKNKKFEEYIIYNH